MRITKSQLNKIIAEEYALVNKKTGQKSRTKDQILEENKQKLIKELKNKAYVEHMLEVGTIQTLAEAGRLAKWLGMAKGISSEIGKAAAAPFKKGLEVAQQGVQMAKQAGEAALDSVTAVGNAIGDKMAASAKAIADAATKEMAKEYQALGEKIKQRVEDSFKAEGKDPEDPEQQEEFKALLASIMNLAQAQTAVAIGEGAGAGEEYMGQLNERLKNNQRILREHIKKSRK